jgi:hypothetical protein
MCLANLCCKTDPGRATELYRQAEGDAQACPGLRAQARMSLANLCYKTDPGRATELYRQVEGDAQVCHQVRERAGKLLGQLTTSFEVLPQKTTTS